MSFAALNGMASVARRSLEGLGYGGSLLFESFYWLLLGRRYGQTVAAAPVASQLIATLTRSSSCFGSMSTP